MWHAEFSIFSCYVLFLFFDKSSINPTRQNKLIQFICRKTNISFQWHWILHTFIVIVDDRVYWLYSVIFHEAFELCTWAFETHTYTHTREENGFILLCNPKIPSIAWIYSDGVIFFPLEKRKLCVLLTCLNSE